MYAPKELRALSELAVSHGLHIFSYACGMDTIREGMDRFAAFVNGP